MIRFLKGAAALLLSLAVFLILLEGGIRLYHRLSRGIPLSAPVNYFPDKDLGWAPKKIEGHLAGTRPRIMVLGDSFSEGMGVPDAKVYASVLGEKWNAEVFLLAGQGYGTLQEFLLLDREIRRIRPDFILLQVCSNDFINNHWELESRSIFNNPLKVRPYWTGQRVDYRFSKRFGAVRQFSGRYSRLAHEIFLRLEKLAALMARGNRLSSVELQIEGRSSEKAMAWFEESVSRTAALVRQIKARSGGVPVAAFTADFAHPYLDRFRKIFFEAGIPFEDRLPFQMITAERDAGRSFRMADGHHWNEDGHRFAGEYLAVKFQLPVETEGAAVSI